MVPPSGKRKRDFASQYQPGGYIPQQDGAGDALYYDPKVKYIIYSYNFMHN